MITVVLVQMIYLKKLYKKDKNKAKKTVDIYFCRVIRYGQN